MRWDELTLAIANAYATAGTFPKPLDPELRDVAHEQWRLLITQRIARAVIDTLLEHPDVAATYGVEVNRISHD